MNLLLPESAACPPGGPPETGYEQRLCRLMAKLSSRFLSLPSSQIDAAIEDTQQLIVKTFDLDRSTLWQVSEDHTRLRLTHCYQLAGFPNPPLLLDAKTVIPWTYATVMSGGIMQCSCLEDLPPEAAADIVTYRRFGSQAMVAIPLVDQQKVFGVLSFATLKGKRAWLPAEMDEFIVVARVFSSLIARHRIELEARQLHAELAHAMRLTAAGELTATFAHEINQPLAAILNNAQAGRRFLADGSANIEEVLAILDDIARDSKRAGGIVRRLRTLAEKKRSAPELCDLNAIVQQVLEFLGPQLRVCKVRCRTVLCVGTAKVDGVAVEFQQVLVNLLLNSMQAMADVPTAEREIRIETQNQDGGVALIVRDNGTGFHNGDADQCFEAFHTAKTDGLGLGLTICRRIANEHGGRIAARNRTDAAAGAEIVLFLPAAEHRPPE